MTLKLVEIREMPQEEITEQVKKSKLELVNLRMKFASRQLDNPSLIKKTRKEIARLLTVQTQKLTGKDTVVQNTLKKSKVKAGLKPASTKKKEKKQNSPED